MIGQVFVTFILLALIYALIALGIAIVFSILDIVNFAHGQMYVWGGIVLYYFYDTAHLNYGISLLMAAVMVGALGMVMERFLFRRVKRIETLGGTGSFLLAIGTALLLESLALLIFGEIGKAVASPVPGVLKLLGVTIDGDRMLVVGVSVALIFGFWVFLKNTKSGRAMRAVAQDREAAYLQGMRVERISMLGFGVGAALAAIAGGLLAPVFAITYGAGTSITVKSFIMMLIGGFGSLTGAVLGAIVLAFCESFGYLVLPGHLVTLLIYSIVVLFFIFRPQGILGKSKG